MKKVLVATDGSVDSEKALLRVIEVSKKEPIEVLVLTVAEEYCPIGLAEMDCDTIRALVMKESKVIMASALEILAKSGISGVGIIEAGSPADVIIEVAKRENVAEIIAASHGKHGAKKFAMGSVTARVAEWAPCPVVIVK